MLWMETGGEGVNDNRKMTQRPRKATTRGDVDRKTEKERILSDLVSSGRSNLTF